MTPAQHRTLQAIAALINLRGFSPTLGEIAAATGAKGRSSVQVHVAALTQGGYVTVLAHSDRTLRLTDKGREALLNDRAVA